MVGRARPVLVRPMVLAVVTAGLMSAAGCASKTCPAFSLSAADHGGQPTPLAAAEWFAAHNSIATVPRTGWHEVSHDANGVVLSSGNASLRAIQGTDSTWQVDSGSSC